MRRVGELLATGLLVGTMAACGSGEDVKPHPSGSPSGLESPTATASALPSDPNDRCAALQPEQWGPVPRNLNMGRIAQILGTTASAVQHGMMGEAVCNPGFPMQEMDQRVSVSGLPGDLGELCVPVVVFTTEPAKPGRIYDHFGVVCAGTPYAPTAAAAVV